MNHFVEVKIWNVFCASCWKHFSLLEKSNSIQFQASLQIIIENSIFNCFWDLIYCINYTFNSFIFYLNWMVIKFTFNFIPISIQKLNFSQFINIYLSKLFLNIKHLFNHFSHFKVKIGLTFEMFYKYDKYYFVCF